MVDAANRLSGEADEFDRGAGAAKEFLAFLKLLLRRHRGRELHLIIDNSSAHGTPAVRRWLEKRSSAITVGCLHVSRTRHTR